MLGAKIRRHHSRAEVIDDDFFLGYPGGELAGEHCAQQSGGIVAGSGAEGLFLVEVGDQAVVGAVAERGKVGFRKLVVELDKRADPGEAGGGVFSGGGAAQEGKEVEGVEQG